ncbi:MAG: hypothetical protein QM635_11090 [Microbacteriaceae bacterium]
MSCTGIHVLGALPPYPRCVRRDRPTARSLPRLERVLRAGGLDW